MKKKVGFEAIVDCQTIIGRANHVKKTNWWQFRGIFLFDDCEGCVLPKVLTKGAFVLPSAKEASRRGAGPLSVAGMSETNISQTSKAFLVTK